MLLVLLPNAMANIAPEGVSVSGIALGGLERKEAADLLDKAICQQKMTIILPSGEISLNPEDVCVQLDMEGLWNAVRRAEAPTDLELLPWLTLDKTALRSILSNAIGKSLTPYTPAAFTLGGVLPALGEADFDESIPCPALLITTGTPGTTAAMEELVDTITEACARADFRVDLRQLLEEKTPDPPNIREIASAITSEASSASIDPVTNEIIPARYGITFDEKEARKLLKQAAPGETIRVPMEYLTPQRIAVDMEFPDILGFCQTPHNDNEERNTNLRLACAALNGVVLQPGETLSYNATLGQRTEAAGYKKAPAYSGTELVDSLGGGICQVSSTLYLCSLYAELETVERINHGYPANYMPVGLDATVSWGKPDLKIRNSWDHPVKIVAEEQNGLVCIWIMGTETRDYYVRLAFSSTGTSARSRICKYDRQTDELIAKEDAALSGYLDDVGSVVGEIGPDQIYRFGMCRSQEIPEPTPEAWAASRRHIAPNTIAP